MRAGARLMLAVALASGMTVPAQAKDSSAKAIRALANGCAAASTYNLKGLEADWGKPSAPNLRFDEVTAMFRGPFTQVAPDDAVAVIRGIIGSSITQSVRYSTATTLWKTADGVWMVSRVDHAEGMPPAPPPPPPPGLYDKPGAEEGVSMVQFKQPADTSYRETRGKLLPDQAAELDRILADPCFTLELAGLNAQPQRDGRPPIPCPADYAGSTLEVTLDGRRRYVGTECRGTLPSAALANIVFYPKSDTPTPPFGIARCDDCYRYYPMPATYARPETVGDPAIDAVVAKIYAAYGRKDYQTARALLEPIAGEAGTHPRRWMLMPMLARLRLLTGDLEGAALAASTAADALSQAKGRDHCAGWAERKASYTSWPKWMRFFEAHVAVCESDLVKPDTTGIDPMMIELIEMKSGAVSSRIDTEFRERFKQRTGRYPNYPDD